MPRDDQPIPAELNLRCTSCGYDLTGLLERRCPECGEPFDPRETWLENERSTWEFHFEHVRTKRDYARLAYVAVTGLLVFGLAFVDPKALLAIPVAVLGELYIVWSGGPGMQIRMSYATGCAAWAILVAVLRW